MISCLTLSTIRLYNFAFSENVVSVTIVRDNRYSLNENFKIKKKNVQMKIEMSNVKFANVKTLITCFFQFCDNVFETRS